MTVLRVTVPDQYFCTKHPDLNITAREIKIKQGQASLLKEKYSPLDETDQKPDQVDSPYRAIQKLFSMDAFPYHDTMWL